MTFKTITTSIALSLLGMLSLKAQEAIPATGGNATGSGGSASYTVGQVAYTTSSSPSISVSQGVQQAYEILTSTIEVISANKLKLEAYPNPTAHAISLSIGNYSGERLTYQLYDYKGAKILRKELNSSQAEVDLHGLAAGVYTLTVFHNNSLIETLRIVKN